MARAHALSMAIASLALHAAGGAAAAGALEPEQLRFQPPAGYREQADPPPADERGVSKRLFLPEQAPGDRFARILVESRPDDGVSTASQFVAERVGRLKQACAGGDAALLGEREENLYRTAVLLSQCPKDPRGLGVVVISKVIYGGELVYVVELEYKYPPFDPGKTPLLRIQMTEAVKWLAGVKLCRGARDQDCRMPAKRLVEMQPRPIPANELAAVAGIERAGMLIYQHDRLAWHGTDAVVHRKADLAGAEGYITELEGEGSGRVVFAGGDLGAPYGVQQVDIVQFKALRVTSHQRAPLPDALASAYRARQSTLAANPMKCGAEPMNSVIFPDPAGDGLLAYWMSSSTEPDVFVHGGHTRFRTSADGRKVRDRLGMTRSCLTMRQEPGQPRFAQLLVSHLVTDMPTEIHVFNSLHYKLPIVVFAPKGTWLVRDGKLERLH